jgi:hypothetical protein
LKEVEKSDARGWVWDINKFYCEIGEIAQKGNQAQESAITTGNFVMEVVRDAI